MNAEKFVLKVKTIDRRYLEFEFEMNVDPDRGLLPDEIKAAGQLQWPTVIETIDQEKIDCAWIEWAETVHRTTTVYDRWDNKFSQHEVKIDLLRKSDYAPKTVLNVDNVQVRVGGGNAQHEPARFLVGRVRPWNAEIVARQEEHRVFASLSTDQERVRYVKRLILTHMSVEDLEWLLREERKKAFTAGQDSIKHQFRDLMGLASSDSTAYVVYECEHDRLERGWESEY